MKLKLILLIFILYTPFANAVNLVCQANDRTDFLYPGCEDNGCTYPNDSIFSIVFDTQKQKIIEVTNFYLYSGKNISSVEISPSNVYFETPHLSRKDKLIGFSIDRVSGDFYALGFFEKSLELTEDFNGKCKVGKKLF
jgi:hypothetical protein